MPVVTGSSPAESAAVDGGKVGGDGVELLAVARAFPKALLSAKLAVSVLALGEVGWVPVTALLLFCLEATDLNKGVECAVGPGP